MRERPHRRDFVRTLALGVSAGAILPRTAVRAEEPDEDKPKADAAGKDKPGKESESPQTEADARMDLVLARFGKQLDPAARKTVRAEVESIVKRAEALRKFPLTNGDGPFPIFRPYRAPLTES
jgi:hypothetical protein